MTKANPSAPGRRRRVARQQRQCREQLLRHRRVLHHHPRVRPHARPEARPRDQPNGALAREFDNHEFSVMTYRTYTGSPFDPIGKEVDGSSPQSYMMFDISALQSMYGANFSRLGKADTYRWHGTTGQQTINGRAGAQHRPQLHRQDLLDRVDAGRRSDLRPQRLQPEPGRRPQARPVADLLQRPARRPQPRRPVGAVQGPGQHLQRAALLRRPQVGDRQPHHRHRQRHADRQRPRQRADEPATAGTPSSPPAATTR